jgi:hypothetical protein
MRQQKPVNEDPSARTRERSPVNEDPRYGVRAEPRYGVRAARGDVQASAALDLARQTLRQLAQCVQGLLCRCEVGIELKGVLIRRARLRGLVGNVEKQSEAEKTLRRGLDREPLD